MEGETLDIQPDEVEVRAEAHAGLAVASEGAILAALQTELTPALVREGQAREFVRRVQELRKQAEFEIADRIRIYLQATPTLLQALRTHQEYVMGETLAIEFVEADPPAGAASAEGWFDAEWYKLGILKAK